MVDNLKVFLSSHINEFKNERKHLSKAISKISFLECKLQEDRGPQAQSTELSSLSAVETCNILVGILGNCFSQITKAEIERAIKTGKYCLIYLKESETRDQEMNEFIHNHIDGDVTYFQFKRKKDLYATITNHLEDRIYELLTRGLEHFKDEQQEIMTKKKKTEMETKRKIQKEYYTAKDVLLEAKESLARNDYLSSVIKCGISLELALKEQLSKTDIVEKRNVENQSITRLIKILVDNRLLDHRFVHNVLEVRAMRNQAVHGARMPSKQATQTAVYWTEELLEKLEFDK